MVQTIVPYAYCKPLNVREPLIFAIFARGVISQTLMDAKFLKIKKSRTLMDAKFAKKKRK